jgi:tRNA (pseudouridine54-N1)-methyltransferase
MRRFVVIGQTAVGSPSFSLLDLPATSGRLDVLLRCLRAALLVSHGLRRDTVVYLVLLGDEAAPRAMRIDGAAVRFLRPDERSLATLVHKALGAAPGSTTFVAVRPGIAIADGGLDVVLHDLGRATPYILEEDAADLRRAALDVDDPVFFIGDHTGFDGSTRASLASLGATPLSVGPISIHADDIVAVVNNELDRRALG